MKRVIIGIWSVLFVIFAYLLFTYISNEIAIKKECSNAFSILGFTQPYVGYYNEGNVLYNQGNYEGAISNYDKALSYNLKEDKDCKVRINKALAMIKPVDIEQIDDSNFDTTIALLEDAKKVLLENGCAKEDNTGHHKDAQQLYNDIDKFEQQLKQQQQQSSQSDASKGTDSDANKDGKDDKKDEQKPDDKNEKNDAEEQKKQEIKKQLLDNQSQGMGERTSEENAYESFDYDNFDYQLPVW